MTSSSNKSNDAPILITGTAGFIGSHVALRLLDSGHQVVGFDNLNDYYDVNLKKARLARFVDHAKYIHVHGDLADREAVQKLFEEHRPSRVIHLAAQAGVRYAAENPHVYVSSNVVGTLHVLEGCRHNGVEHLVFASTSSVYGANTKMPFAEDQPTEHPLTLYAATKKANEQMAHSYAHLYGIPCTGLRFFTVYGPWGRPDMALFLFTKAILDGKPIKVFNHGKHKRSFTYVDDIVEGIMRILEKPPIPSIDHRALTSGGRPSLLGADGAAALDPSRSPVAPYQIFNIGNEQSIELLRYIEVLERELGKKAEMEMFPLQPGDVPDTEASVQALQKAVNYQPAVAVEKGIKNFVDWYRKYYEA